MKQTLLINYILDLLFPPTCIGCGVESAPLCESCLTTIKLLDHQTCYICRNPSTRGATCAAHCGSKIILDRLIVACSYSANPLLKKAIHALKYKLRSRAIAGPLGTLLARTFELLNIEPSFIIVPIPLHTTREKKRGFNQAQLLAQALALKVQNPISIRNDILIRTRPTLSQAESKTREERLKNLHQAFKAVCSLDSSLTYLLLDDVCATCATLEDACRALKEAGAKKVWGIVVAR